MRLYRRWRGCWWTERQSRVVLCQFFAGKIQHSCRCPARGRTRSQTGAPTHRFYGRRRPYRRRHPWCSEVEGPAVFALARSGANSGVIFCRYSSLQTGAQTVRRPWPSGQRRGPAVRHSSQGAYFRRASIGKLRQRVGLAPGVVQVRAAFAGALPALAAAPCVDFFVVAGQQHGRHGAALPHFGAGELRVFEQSVPVASSW